MSFSADPFGSVAFSESEDAPLDSDAFQAFLADVSAPRCWLLELDAFSLATTDALSAAFSDSGFAGLGFSEDEASAAGGVQTQYYSTHGYITQTADAPSNTWYDGRLTEDVRVERRIVGRDGIGGLASVYAELSLINADGALDAFLRDYAPDGRRAVVLIGRPTDAKSTFGNVFTGVVEKVRIGVDVVRIRLSDGASKLAVPVNATVYAGSGGTEGGSDLKGKPKPKCWGHVYNVAPPLVDSTNLIYQVNDGAISDVPNVWDRGVALTKVGGAPAAGQYQVNAAAGTFTLGATPAGTVTADVQGDASGAGYVTKTGEIVLRLLAIPALTSSEIEPASFANLNNDVPAEVGVYVGTDGANVDQVVGVLLEGIGAFGGFNRHGAFSVGLVAAPTGAVAASFSNEDILEIEREPLPAAVEPIIWRAAVDWQKNYTVQNDLAASVTAARRTFAAEPARREKVEDTSIRTRHLLAQEYAPGGNFYAVQADATTEAQRRFDLWSKEGRALYRAQLPLHALTRDLGQVLTLMHARHGLSAGRDVRVLGHAVKGTKIELVVLA